MCFHGSFLMLFFLVMGQRMVQEGFQFDCNKTCQMVQATLAHCWVFLFCFFLFWPSLTEGLLLDSRSANGKLPRREGFAFRWTVSMKPSAWEAGPARNSLSLTSLCLGGARCHETAILVAQQSREPPPYGTRWAVVDRPSQGTVMYEMERFGAAASCMAIRYVGQRSFRRRRKEDARCSNNFFALL